MALLSLAFCMFWDNLTLLDALGLSDEVIIFACKLIPRVRVMAENEIYLSFKNNKS